MLDIPSKLLPLTTVVNVIPQPLDFVYRFWGTRFTNIHKQEMTGKSINELLPVQFSKSAKQGFMTILERKEPILFHLTVHNKNVILIDDKTIRLPLSDDGITVNKIMTVTDSTNLTNISIELLFKDLDED